METASNIDVQALSPKDIKFAYRGKMGCMCGCKGEYFTATEHATRTLNPKVVTRILRTIQAAEPEEVEIDEAGDWISLTTKGRTWVVYLTE